MESQEILIIDDDLAFSSVMKVLLEQRGHQVLLASDGQMGLELAAAYLPDVIILDVNLPTFSGFDVVKQLKQNPDLADIPVIMISALSQDSNVVRGLFLGSRRYLTKPFTVDQLLTAIAEQSGAVSNG